MEDKKSYQICTRCIMDTSDTEIVFDCKHLYRQTLFLCQKYP